MKALTICPCCSNGAALWVKSADRNRHLSDEEFGYYQCSGCGLVFLDPVPSNLGRFYDGGYQPIPKSLDALRLIAAKERYRLQAVMEKVGGDLLEIGPWVGIFSINAKDAGFKVDAIEMSVEASTFLRDVVGIDVTTTNDASQALLASDKRYDVIAMWHSLEHLPEPWEVLNAASKRLKPGGILLIAIPNVGGAQAQLLGKHWWHLDAPRHLYFWPAADLARLVNRFGLETIKLDTHDMLSTVLTKDAWYTFFRMHVRVPVLDRIVAKLLTPIASRVAGEGGLTAVFRAP